MAWAVSEGEPNFNASPMERMRPPAVPEQPVAVLSEEQIGALLRACHGTAFEDRRDEAIVRLLIDTEMRRGECAGLAVDDLDLDQDVAVVLGKGRRQRACPFGKRHSPCAGSLPAQAALASARCETGAVARLSRRPLSGDGIMQMLQRRGVRAESRASIRTSCGIPSPTNG